MQRKNSKKLSEIETFYQNYSSIYEEPSETGTHSTDQPSSDGKSWLSSQSSPFRWLLTLDPLVVTLTLFILTLLLALFL